ncbi:MAG TPA: transcription termination/antitermination protein NusG [Cyclobacteriaceae bacterium]|nr:transcription termination/antitermination protein NusG [Chitinophagales bacterium]HNK83550.1 transcription termination/antitermination protein NusG [Cyclobacteriaceae bacterium]HNF69355.1 transcription termination/antitermination protein NusG [Chitinophagales bacterium]HNI53511.1 transcription termination/antitermination protein NusG [Chitinophagales bacterium]HNJ88513.1 transcription termination/antitermination protein NusG [Chitinophagales bacterium]
MADDKKWYVLRVISGKERKLREYVEQHVKRLGWEHIISQVLVPTEKVYKIKNGKKVIHEKNSLPGYILIEAVEGKMTPEMMQVITGITNVIDFLGKENPVALRRNEVNRILGKMDEMSEEGVSLNEPFIIGETVKIIDGPFNEFLGNVDEVHEDKKKVKVIVKIFGRKTPVELNFAQVEKVN